MRRHDWKNAGLAGACALVGLLAAGCGSKGPGVLVANQRPTLQLSARPEPGDSVFYAVRLQWFASDADGRVTHYLYAVDPPAEGDTSWVRFERSEVTLFFRSHEPDSASIQVPFPARTVTSRDYHVFAIKAVDNEGAASPTVWDAFTSETVAPQTQITDPRPSRLATALTAPNVVIKWSGTDPDGVLTQKPIKYKFKLVSEAVIKASLGLPGLPGAQELQDFFSQEAPFFASWDSLPPDTTQKQYEGLTPGQYWYFAIVAFDEAGAYEPRFNRDNNLLRFKPSTEVTPPKLCVFNSFFARCQSVGAFDLNEERVVHIEVPADAPVPINWDATPGVPGTEVAGYRWVLDPLDGDIFNETPRDNERQTYRWSSWSLNEKSATVGPFPSSGDNTFHRFYVEARDNVGGVSIMIVDMRVLKATFENPLLVFDDARLNADHPDGRPYATYPTEAVLDTLLYAVGDKPYKARPPGTLSKPGVFAGFDYDTLDYRFTLTAGLPLSVISHYANLVWYTELSDAARTGDKFSSFPKGALFFINTSGELNTLAVYLSQSRGPTQGNVWLFGSGVMLSVGNGYVTRFGSSPAPYPLMSGGDRPNLTHILWPGNFLYDYMKIRSQVDIIDQAGAGNILGKEDELKAAIPYLPQFHTPGAPWPPEGWTGRPSADDDPRVGPASARNLAKWTGLPKLTITTEFPDWPTPLPPTIPNIPYVSLPNFILESFPNPNPPPATISVSTLDTLYLYKCPPEGYKNRSARDWPDGKPFWFHYSGGSQATHGQVNWSSAPIWYFERTQLQIVADKILGQFGLRRNPNPRAWTGPGGVISNPMGVVESP